MVHHLNAALDICVTGLILDDNSLVKHSCASHCMGYREFLYTCGCVRLSEGIWQTCHGQTKKHL